MINFQYVLLLRYRQKSKAEKQCFKSLFHNQLHFWIQETSNENKRKIAPHVDRILLISTASTVVNFTVKNHMGRAMIIFLIFCPWETRLKSTWFYENHCVFKYLILTFFCRKHIVLTESFINLKIIFYFLLLSNKLIKGDLI